MFKHYLKQAFRNFRANKLIFGGSIFTVFLGVLSISLLSTYVYNELTMNDFHHREKDIYITVIQASPESQWETINAKVFFNFNYKEYPELENLVSILKYKEGEVKFTYEKSSFSPEGIVADSSFFRVFDFKLKTGDEKKGLSDPDAVFFSERLAFKMFGNENPIGKTVKFSGNSEKVFTVKGIIEALPSNSSISFDFILPNHSTDFSRIGAEFLLAKHGFDKNAFIKKIENIGQKHPQFTTSKISLIALKDVYFNGEASSFHDVFSRFGDKRSLNILYVIIGIIFIISALNFSNFQVININASVKNIGINKISGAKGNHILCQKTTEVFLLICISTFLITGAYFAILPYFNGITGVRLSPHPLMVLLVNSVTLGILAILAMIYPTFVFSRIRITQSLRNQIFPTNKLLGRQAIVTVQFALSIFLLIASIVAVKQLHMMLDKDLGFNYSNIISTKLFQKIPYNGSEEEQLKRMNLQTKNFQYVKNELEKHMSIEAYSQGLSPLEPFPMPWNLSGSKSDYTTQNSLPVYPAYHSLFALELTEGRFFDAKKDKSRESKIVINEAAKKFWGIKDITQSRLLNKYWFNDKGFEILGVVKDFNYEHLSVKPLPLVMVYFEDIDAQFLIKFREGATQKGLQFVQRLYEEINPGETFQYSFLSDEIAALYQKEKRLSRIYILFTLIAFMISIAGLFSIALYDTQKRTKEIGIRRVNGARVIEILTMLNRDFVKWVVIAFVVATPFAYYTMNKWLENFAYKISLSWWIFALAGLLALGIAILTVSWQSWKAATKNPVEALRYE